MSRKHRGNLPLIRRLTILLPWLCLASPVHADDDGVPALLQFAEHYRNQHSETKETPLAGKSAQKRQDRLSQARGLDTNVWSPLRVRH